MVIRNYKLPNFPSIGKNDSKLPCNTYQHTANNAVTLTLNKKVP